MKYRMLGGRNVNIPALDPSNASSELLYRMDLDAIPAGASPNGVQGTGNSWTFTPSSPTGMCLTSQNR